MFKKIFFLTCAVFCIVFLTTSVVFAAFSDVNEGNLNYEAIEYVKDEGIVSGYPDGTFKPLKTINRAEFTKIIVVAIYDEQAINSCIPGKFFPDVSESDWFYPYICTAANEGIVSGYPDGTFKPGNNINMAESAKIIVSAFGYGVTEKELWYQPFIEKLEESNAIPPTICSISKNISRGEMAEMIYRLKENITTKISRSFFSGNPETFQTTTFIKSYGFKDADSINGVSLTSDGGYILTGEAIINKYMSDSDAFIMKVDSVGKKEWVNFIQSQNNITSDPLQPKAGDDRGYAVSQMSDGSYILAGETSGFLTDELFSQQEFSGDILISKFDASGQHIWTETLMGLSLDIPVNIIADDNGGFYLSAAVAEVGYTGADFLHHFAIGKFDSFGNKIWIKKTNLLLWDSLIAGTKPNQSFLKDSDGNILLTGMIAVPHIASEYDNGDPSEEKRENLAVIVKLDGDGETVWVKSLEGTPVQLNGISSRVRAGSFYAIEQTSDKGYLVFGLLSPLITGGPRAKVLPPEYLVAIKLDKSGNYKWAKSVGIGAPLTGFFTAKAYDGGFIFIKNYIAWNNKSDEDYINYIENAQQEAQNDELGIDISKGTIDFTEKIDVKLNKILAIKTDSDFKVQWAKKIGVGKEFFGFDVKATPDKGLIIAGLQRNSTAREVNYGQTFNDDDALLVKLDVNGNVNAEFDYGLISNYSAISEEDISTYIVAPDFTPIIEDDDELTVNQQNPTISSVDVRTNDLYAPKNYMATSCPIEFQTKTWAQINFDNTTQIDEIAEGKSQEVNDEMLPVLKRAFNEVKSVDNIGGFSLEYVVDRLVTREDMQAIKKEFEALGYTTYSEDTDQLIMNKIGRMLVIVFSTNDRLRGIITVSF